MENNIKGTSIFSNALIWFGAGVSIAEILTGTYFAPLGFSKAFLAIVLGHIIGGFMMYLAGTIGANHRKSSMETTALFFGTKGAMIFATINIIQLIGWTSIMIFDGASFANEVISVPIWMLSVIIGVLICVWILIGISKIQKLNTVAMLGLFFVSLTLAKIIFIDSNGATLGQAKDAISFGAAVELATAMPLSWLPLISDYTKDAEKPKLATFTSVIVYNIVSIFMYTIGMGAALYTGEVDIAVIMTKAGLGIFGLFLIIFSTVTTTFLDAYSAGISSQSIIKNLNEKAVAIIVTVIGVIFAITLPLGNIMNFLYFIGSVFAPMIAILIADYYILKKEFYSGSFNVLNIILWGIGFINYRFILGYETILGITSVNIVFTILVTVIANKFLVKNRGNYEK